MGRPKGSKNKTTTSSRLSKVEKSTKQTNNSSTKQTRTITKQESPSKKEVIAVPIIETPLFMCRRCQGAFETTGEYAQHPCPVQIFNVEVENETPDFEITEIEEISDEEKILRENFSIMENGEVEKKPEVKPVKKQRKPYKKKDKTTDDSKSPVQCQTCQKTFTRKYHLERHLIHTSCNPGDIVKEEFSCEVCGKIFSRIDNLRMHLRAHLGQKTRSRDFQCPFCEKSFYGSSLLNIHVRTHTREKPYLCDWEGCGKGFPSSGALTKHRRVHTGERPYKCPQCGNRFAAKETLNRHVRTHTGRRDHKCKICGKEFIQNTQLKAHMFYHNGENALTCDDCGKQFNRKTRLREHIEFIHLKKEMPKCTMCNKKFMRREDLNRHVETHIGERLHSCTMCDKKFVTKAAVRIHMRVHQVEQPALCSYCNKNFLRMDCLVRHMRSKHRDMLQQIIVEAETKKIIKTLGGTEEFEIIYFKDNESQSQADEENYDMVSLMSDVEEGAPIFLDDDLLMTRISELLQIVIEESLLKELGFGKKPIDEVLCSVLEQCSRKPLIKSEVGEDASTRMRENTKQLFSMVLDEDHIKSLLNNYTVDEVITIVLRMAKEN